MEEIEKKFKCPYCGERISMLLDLSAGEAQSYIEDCEVCCRPILVSFSVEGEKLQGFSAQAT